MSGDNVQLVAAGHPWKEESVLYSASEILIITLRGSFIPIIASLTHYPV